MATMLDGVTVSDAQAKKIVKIAIEQNAYDSDMPGTKKERIEAAHEIIAFCIDAWKTDGARPDDDDPEIAEGAEAILEIFKVVGIEADDDGTITMPEDESEEDEDEDEYEDEDEEDEDEDEDDDEDDEEGPFEPDDYIEGYSELTVKTKVAKLKELDPEDDDDAAVLEAIKDWEEQQDKPASRVLNLIEELLGEYEDEEDEEYEGDEDEELEDEEDDDEDEDEEELEEEEEDEEDEEDDDDEEEEDDEELGEPWDGYDKLKVTEIKAQLNEMFEEGELTADQLEYVKEYEEAQDQPSKRTLKLCDELIAKLGDSDEDDADDDEDDDPPAPKGKKLYISVGGKVVATLPAKGGELTIAVK